MAKLVLTIEANSADAIKGVQALRAQVDALAQSLSHITVNKDLTAQIDALTKHYTALAAAQAKIATNANKQAIADEKLRQQQIKSATEALKLASAQAKLDRASQKTSTSVENLQKKFANLLSTIKSIKNAYPEGTFEDLEHSVRENLQAAQEGSKGLNELGAAYSTLSKDIAVARAETDKVTTAVVKSGDSIGSLAKKFFLWQITATLVMKPLRLIQDALSSINETLVKTEDTVIALQRVLPAGSATDEEISSKIYGIAERYGQTFENVSEIATNFARTGMSWANTIKATEAAVLALNVAELDAEEATNGLIAILSQFNLEASDLETVIDKLNKTADNFPVTTQKILAALQRTGSAASNANLTLDQTIALVTALSKATGRSGENIGTALNSLIQYSSKSSALDTFAALSKESADVVNQFRQGGATILDVWQQVSKEIKNLKSDQADLLDQYFNTEDGEALKDALDGELQDIYTELGGVYDTANTFRKNYFIALLGNMDTVEQAMDTLGDAAGYSQTENEKYLKTYTARLNTVKAQWQDIANSEQGLLGIKKALVDVGSVLLTIIKWTGGLRTTLIAISTVIWLIFGDKIISGVQSMVRAIGGLVTGLRTAATAAAGLQATLGWIGIAATAISMIVGVVQQAADEAKRAEEERRSTAQSTISDVNDTISALNEYIGKLDELKAAQSGGKDVSAELSEVQKELKKNYEGVAEAIGKSNDKLQDNIDLTSEAARQAAIDSALNWRLTNEKAIQSATKDVESNTSVSTSRMVRENLPHPSYSHIKDVLDKIGLGDAFNYTHFYGLFGTENEMLEFSLEGQKDAIIKQIEDINAYVNENGLSIGVTQDELDFLKEIISEAYNKVNTEAYKANKEIYDYNKKIEKLINGGTLAEFLGIQEETNDSTKEWSNNIAEVTKKYDDLIDKLKELRDAEKESLELEERKQAVLEAQKALDNARNEATVRRFNEATGQWEWQTDEKKIAEAEKDLEEARRDLEEQAYDTIIDQLEQQTATNQSILDVIKAVAPLLGNDFGEAVKGAIKSGSNVDLDQPVKSYDSGGVASGLGFMPKATALPESVNDPELTAKILSPVSNEQFHRYVRDMGLMFETSRQYVQSPVIERIGGNTDNSVNNSGQIIFGGGLTVGADKRGSSIDDILALAGIVAN